MSVSINRSFYNQLSPEDWKLILGENLHYHNGIFSKPTDTFQSALENAVRSFYGWIPEGASLLDLGSGWGGPARLLRAEKGCTPLCITISDSQAAYIKSLQCQVIQADLEERLPLRGHWDIALMLESLEHIKNKGQLLEEIRSCASRLILRVNCTTRADMVNQSVFGSSMMMPTQSVLLDTLHNSGWKVRYICNRRSKTFESVIHWKKGIEALRINLRLPSRLPTHLMALESMCDRALLSPQKWMKSNPLIDIVAD